MHLTRTFVASSMHMYGIGDKVKFERETGAGDFYSECTRYLVSIYPRREKDMQTES